MPGHGRGSGLGKAVKMREPLGRRRMRGNRSDERKAPAKRRRYLDALQDGLAGLDEARIVLAGVAGRMEKGRPA